MSLYPSRQAGRTRLWAGVGGARWRPNETRWLPQGQGRPPRVYRPLPWFLAWCPDSFEVQRSSSLILAPGLSQGQWLGEAGLPRVAQRSVLENCYSKDIFACVLSRSGVRLFVTPWTVACLASLSMGFSRREYWSGYLPKPRSLWVSLRSPVYLTSLPSPSGKFLPPVIC